MIAVSEIFGPTVQGEGALIGVPTVFVRTGGCDYRCSWCDTRYAVDVAFKKEWLPSSTEAILAEINRLSGAPILVTLSGGNPALQPLAELITQGQQQGHRFALETQGSIAQDWFAELEYLTLSPKPPSSGMAFNADKFAACLRAAGKAKVSLKLVIADEADYLWAQNLAAHYPTLAVYLQPCNLTPATPNAPDTLADVSALNQRFQWLVARTTQDRWYSARILPQLHVLIWNNERGV